MRDRFLQGGRSTRIICFVPQKRNGLDTWGGLGYQGAASVHIANGKTKEWVGHDSASRQTVNFVHILADTSGTNQVNLDINDRRRKERKWIESVWPTKTASPLHIFFFKTLDYHVIKRASVLINPNLCSASISLPINYSVYYICCCTLYRDFPLLLLSIYQNRVLSICQCVCFASFGMKKYVSRSWFLEMHGWSWIWLSLHILYYSAVLLQDPSISYIPILISISTISFCSSLEDGAFRQRLFLRLSMRWWLGLDLGDKRSRGIWAGLWAIGIYIST